MLQQYGFHGSLEDFNQRVSHATEVYLNRFGAKPTPGLAFDLARSPFEDVSKLFDGLPDSQRAARAKAYTDPDQQMFTRDSAGNVTIQTPLMRKLAQVMPIETVAQAKKQYPTAAGANQMGVIPLDSLDQNRLEDAVKLVDKYVGSGNIPVTENGLDLSEFEQYTKAAAFKPHALSTREIGQFNADYSTGAGGHTEEDAFKIVHAVTTAKQAQSELNDRMGTSLPVTGYFNQDWLKALGTWMHSADYFRQVAQKQAQTAGFGNDYGAFLKAWQFKQHAIKKHGAAQWFVAAMPLHIFAHGGGLGITTGIFDSIAPRDSLGFSTPLHALTNSAGLVLDTIGGGVSQGKAYAAAGHAIVQNGVQGKTFEEGKANIRHALTSHPSWLRVLYPQMTAHPTGRLAAIDNLTNIAGDLILLRKPVLTGEVLGAGDYAAALRSPYINASSHWAFKYLQEGKLGRAAAMLEGGPGSERLLTHLAKRAARGDLTEGELRDHVAELYANGQTTVEVGRGTGTTVTGSTLPSLRVRALPTPGLPGKSWLHAKHTIRDTLDKWNTASNAKTPGLVTNPIDFLRAEFSHLPGKGDHYLYDPKLPERLHDFAFAQFKDADLANKWESDLIRLRSKDNIAGLQKLEKKVQDLYAKKYPEGRDYAADDPFKPTTLTEAPSVFHFPGGGQKEVLGPLDALSNWQRTVSGGLNRLAAMHARLILSGFPFLYAGGGFSLFYKHMVGDTLRRAVAEDGYIFGQSSGMKRAANEIQGLADSNPDLSRKLGTYLARSKDGETRWLLNRGANAVSKTFDTGEHFGHGNYMTAAGSFLRRKLDDPALTAYQNSTEQDLRPLVSLVLKNRHYRGLLHSAIKKGEAVTAEDYAQKLWSEYAKVEDAAANARIENPWDAAKQVLSAHRGGTADKALGKWVADNKLDFHVPHGQVEKLGTFDKVTGDYINFIMRFNKWNRVSLAQRSMYRVYDELTKAGWEKQAAMETAMDVGEKVTVHHMLDFANRLKVEQDLRWVSYFATKHRLYWKWVLGTFVRRPGVAATIYDTKNVLNDKGNIPLNILGHKLEIPAARLVWVPGKEYSEVSPLVQALGGVLKGESPFAAAKGTFGNVFTRSDTGLLMLARAAAAETGVKLPVIGGPPTYGSAVHGLDDFHKAMFYREVNSFQNDYFDAHGHYAPEPDAVKNVLWSMAANELWRSNLPLPVLPAHDTNDAQKLLRQFMLMKDPAKRRQFLDQHQDLQLYFGIYKDPKVYLHNKEFWRQYNTYRDQYRQARETVFEQAARSGMTPKLREQMKAIGATFNGQFEQMLKADEKGGGTWGKQILADPLVDPRKTIHDLFPDLPKSQLDNRVPGQSVKDARDELKLLNDPQYVKKTYGAGTEAQSQIKKRKVELITYLENFNAQPTDKLGKNWGAYQKKYVDTYWTQYNKRYTAAHTGERLKRDVLLADFRKWRDAQDQPVVVDGVKYPSPARMAWFTLDPQTRDRKLALIATDDWSHLTDFEKELLGRKTRASQGWDNLTRIVAAFRGHIKMPGVPTLEPGQKLDKKQMKYLVHYVEHGEPGYLKPTPGFYKDWLFSQEPKYRRMQFLTPVKDSPYRAEWSHIFADANTLGAHIGHGYSKSALSQVWQRYVNEPGGEFQSWLKQQPAGFRKELKLFGPDVLDTLLN